ncbi:hypothetical protein M9H77_02789 [Catharanthus roseus]|uniref:Uncharacterized protein n=1 Tax=Catharanthus roseus TaxID=4058 RepID=A0ACC0C9G1_CATRO|nr:hypothetical protein M9H77_02789 [Catharanthus roseus]
MFRFGEGVVGEEGWRAWLINHGISRWLRDVGTEVLGGRGERRGVRELVLWKKAGSWYRSLELIKNHWEDSLEYVVMVMWGIWIEWCNRVFRKVSKVAGVVVSRVQSLLSDFMVAMEGGRTVEHAAVITQLWHPPVQGQVKVRQQSSEIGESGYCSNNTPVTRGAKLGPHRDTCVLLNVEPVR